MLKTIVLNFFFCGFHDAFFQDSNLKDHVTLKTLGKFQSEVSIPLPY